MKVLFVCSQNRLRSPTAARVFSGWPGIETRSAGTDATAQVTISEALLDWADLVVCMEREHRLLIRQRWPLIAAQKRMASVDIPDEFEFMAPALVETLRERVPHLLT